MATREEEISAKPKKRSPLLIIIIVLVVALAAGGAYFLGIRGKSSAPPPPEPKSLALEALTVNLADMGYKRFLRIAITLEYTDDKLPQELDKYRYKVRDAIISVLRSKSVADLDTEEETNNLREEIKQQINSVMSTKVDGVYFEDFIIQ